MIISYYQLDIVNSDGEQFSYTFDPTVEATKEAITILENEYRSKSLEAFIFRKIHRQNSKEDI